MKQYKKNQNRKTHDNVIELCFMQMDPGLELYRKELVMEAGRKLDKARMIRFEERTGYFASTDLGRTASHFYIKYNTIEVCVCVCVCRVFCLTFFTLYH